jgi:hypothetical protein
MRSTRRLPPDIKVSAAASRGSACRKSPETTLNNANVRVFNAVAELEKHGVRVRSMTEEFDTSPLTIRREEVMRLKEIPVCFHVSTT